MNFLTLIALIFLSLNVKANTLKPPNLEMTLKLHPYFHYETPLMWEDESFDLWLIYTSRKTA